MHAEETDCGDDECHYAPSNECHFVAVSVKADGVDWR